MGGVGKAVRQKLPGPQADLQPSASGNTVREPLRWAKEPFHRYKWSSLPFKKTGKNEGNISSQTISVLNLRLPEGEGWGEGEFGRDMYTLLNLGWMTSRDLLYRIGNSA